MKLQFPTGSEVAKVRITGNRKNAEPQEVRIEFPGGHVSVTRAKDGDDADYWVHVAVNHPDDGQNDYDEADTAKITDARLDIHGQHSADVNPGDFNNPKLYHVALRVTTDAVEQRQKKWRGHLEKVNRSTKERIAQ